MKIKMIDPWMQTEGTKLILVMNFSVLDFFKFASRMSQIAQILALDFQNFPGGWGEGAYPCPPPPPCPLAISSIFFISISRLWVMILVSIAEVG